MAGSEVSFLGQKHSSQLGALVYLDANADPIDFPWSNAEYRSLVMKSMKDAPSPPQRTVADNASVDAFRAFQKRSGGFPFPPGDIRAIYQIQPPRSFGQNRTPS